MRASIDTQLSIAEWGQILGFNPWELAQVGTGFPKLNPAQCDSVFYQYPWQTQRFVCREEIARAINEAETQIAQFLGYWPAPKYFYDEVSEFPYRVGSTLNVDRNPDYHVRWGKVIKSGVYTKAPIQGNAAVVVSDRDGDTVNDTFTVTVPTTVTDPDEIHIYYSLTDRFNEAISNQWEIRPISVTLSGGNATIKGHLSLLIKPVLTEGVSVASLDVTGAIYVTTVDVYREYIDDTVSSTIMNQGWFAYNDTLISPTPIYVKPYNQGQGILRWELYADACSYNYIPDRIHTNYIAGISRQNNRMNFEMADIVAHLSVIYLASQTCGCERSNLILGDWRGLPSDQSDRRPLSLREIDSPWGPQKGALYAWQKVQNLMLVRGLVVE